MDRALPVVQPCRTQRDDTQEQVVIEEILLEAEEKMEKAVVVAKEDFAAIRTGRAHPAMFNKIVADYYGAITPINQLASFSVPEPRMAVVTPFDKSALRNIEQAIRDSDLGVNPSNDGNIIRVTFPELTEERRREYIKVARGKAEDSKVSIRAVRRKAKDALDKLVKDKEAGEDEVRRAEKELDDTTAKYVAQVDELLKHKEAELLEV
ncbi:ribosome recycling factor [Streptomyces showdoensis]